MPCRWLFDAVMVPFRCRLDGMSMPFRCDPTPISLTGGVLLTGGAFNSSRSLMAIWGRLRCRVSRVFGNSCVYPAAKLRGSLGVVAVQLAGKGSRAGLLGKCPRGFCEILGSGAWQFSPIPPVDYEREPGRLSRNECREYRRPLAVIGKRGRKN